MEVKRGVEEEEDVRESKSEMDGFIFRDVRSHVSQERVNRVGNVICVQQIARANQRQS